MKKSQLEVNVIAQNAMAQFFPVAVKSAHEHFSKFVGKAIFKVGGGVMEKCKGLESRVFTGKLADGATNCTVDMWIEKRDYVDTVSMTVKICVHGGSYDDNSYFCEYQKRTSDIFEYIGGVLGAAIIPDNPEFFDIDELKAAGKAANEAAKVYDAIYCKVPYQFRSALNVQRLTNS